MIAWIGKDRLDDDAVASWKEFLCDNAETFVGNRDDFPVDVFFTVVVDAAPVFVTLSGTRVFPV